MLDTVLKSVKNLALFSANLCENLGVLCDTDYALRCMSRLPLATEFASLREAVFW
jgi:hypothetical protein